MKKRVRSQNQDGSALIPVLCILCVFMAFILALVLSSYQVLSKAQFAASKEQCRISAIAFSQGLEEELCADDPSDEKRLSEFQSYVRERIQFKGWAYYNKDEAGHNDKKAVADTLKVDIPVESDAFDKSGKMKIAMHWESNSADMVNGDYRNVVLVVKVTSELRDQTYAVTTQYELCKPGADTIDWRDTANWKWAVSFRGI